MSDLELRLIRQIFSNWILINHPLDCCSPGLPLFTLLFRFEEACYIFQARRDTTRSLSERLRQMFMSFCAYHRLLYQGLV